jgi:outer membrane protein assembly factor BamB
VLVTPGGKLALMAALDKHTGRTVWTSEPLRDDRAWHSSPLLFRHAGRRVVANCSSAYGFGVDADSGQLLWTVPLRSPYGVNVATPLYHAGRVFCMTPYVYGTCYRLQPQGAGFQPEQEWSTTLDTCTGTMLMLDSLLVGRGYKKHKSWPCPRDSIRPRPPVAAFLARYGRGGREGGCFSSFFHSPPGI